jgi:drug/metabolite transporter (DMT)-like permease
VSLYQWAWVLKIQESDGRDEAWFQWVWAWVGGSMMSFKVPMKWQSSRSFIEIIIAGIGFSFLGIFGRLSFNAGLSVGELLTFRFGLAALLLWLFLAMSQPHLLKLPLRQILISCLLGFGGYAVFATMYFEAIHGVSVAIAAMLLFTFPIFVNLGAVVFLKEQLTRRQWVSLLLAVIGLALLLWGDMTIRKLSSLMMGLGAAVVYAGYVLISGEVQKQVNPWSSSVYVITAAALGLFVFHHPQLSRIFEFDRNEILCIFGIAIISTIIPLSLFLSGMQKTTSSKASILAMVEPISAALFAWLLLGEALSGRQLCGSLLVISGLFLNRK